MKKILGILIFTLISIFTSGNLVFADEISERLKSMKCVTDYSKNPDIEVIDTIKIGMYPQNDITGVNKEPIEWIALKRNNDKVLLVSKYVLDAVDEISAVSEEDRFENYKWDKSFYRKWLNEDFYNVAFSDDEKKRIMTTALDNKRWCDNTYDKIFPLTYDEWREFRDTKEQMGLSSDNFIFRSKLTNYSKKRRDDAFYIAESFQPAQYRVELDWSYDNESEYLLRTMDSYTFNGKYLMGNSQYVTGFNRGGYAGLRPAMWVCVDENTDLQNTINNDLNVEVEEHKYELRNDGIYMDGVLQTKANNGWIFWNGYYRYLNERGETAHGCWVDGRYLSSYGQMYRAQILPDGVRYVDDNGYLVDINVDFAQSIAKRPLTPNSWYKTDAGFYYFIEADGASTKKGWYKENGVDYYFNPDNGIMVTGWWKVQYKNLGDWCYFNDIHPEDPKIGLDYKTDKPYGAAIGCGWAGFSEDTPDTGSRRDRDLTEFKRPTPEDLDNLSYDELRKKYYLPYVSYGGTKTYSVKP